LSNIGLQNLLVKRYYINNKRNKRNEGFTMRHLVSKSLLIFMLAGLGFALQVNAKSAKITGFERLAGKMVAIPGGSFQMGSNSGFDDEKPVHRVTVPAFKMSETEVTFAQWDACVSAGGCGHDPDDEGWGRGNRPVIRVSYEDITQQFIPWLNKATGKTFRLPSEAEWEYAARGGSTSKYNWGNSISCSKAQYDGGKSSACYFLPGGDYRGTAKVKSYRPNIYGLYDMHGNVWEWTEDCWSGSYNDTPVNGSAWQRADCAKRVLRGGSWSNVPPSLRSASRESNTATARYFNHGFRLVQGL